MCVLEGKRKASITLDLPLKQTETGKTTFHKDRGGRKKDIGPLDLMCSHSSNGGERTRQNAGWTYMAIPRLSYYIKGKLIKKKRKEKEKYHTAFSFPTIIFQFSVEKCQPITN